MDESAELLSKSEIYLENNNKYDKNAARVEIDSFTVGYLSRENAKIYPK